MKKIVVVSVAINLVLAIAVCLMCGRVNYLEKYNLALQSRNSHQAYLLDEANDELSAIYGVDWIATMNNK